jgi:DNA-binding NarL/FixJ family response regulator
MDSRTGKPRTSTLPAYGGEPTKALAAGNSQKFIESISRTLSGRDGVRLLGGAMNREEAAERVVLLNPDVVLIDINLDYELGGIDTAFALRRIAPATAFVIISPFADVERLAMAPRGLGLEWSYLLASTAEDGDELASAIRGASWSIPYIDRAIDRSQMGRLRLSVDQAVSEALGVPVKPSSNSRRGVPSYWPEWTGTMQKFRLSDETDETGGAGR